MTEVSKFLDYSFLVERLDEANLRMSGVTPCSKGNGECYIRDIPVTPNDAELIKRAREEGLITDQTRQDAIKRASNKKRDVSFIGW